MVRVTRPISNAGERNKDTKNFGCGGSAVMGSRADSPMNANSMRIAPPAIHKIGWPIDLYCIRIAHDTRPEPL